ncbi:MULTISPECIES: zinc-ribbon domain-containing protein [unclassified Fusobacterium]|uniref:zinc-ribbon domain-containing protein n=1 Tax=unclassified Fusobacterium TaxID=2648384 RepID=UPI001B8D53F8|nr:MULTISPECIES: zinc-ribbon domain-containing protein [unclassified Fusobacterium]MBR8702352.1 hypothetical protein [Fusobacterium sp. DD45]MBR8712169.1 hypothetical protein [Fusobacterium sp. DD28]MBR8752748.1 hypothetical protein [Fusobacterium sp. DD26]
MDGTEFKEEQSVKICTKCGSQLKDGMKFCPECGTPVEEKKAPTNCRKCGAPLLPGAKFCEKCGAPVQEEKVPTNCRKCGAPLPPGAKFCERCGAPVQGINNTQGGNNSDEITFEDIQENKFISILCYFGIFMLIPFLMRPNSKFVRFHCNQGLILLIFYFICGIVMVIPVLGWIIGIIGFIFSLILFIIGIINVVKGNAKELPLIGKYRIIK